jgi:O-antigen/teichoic acid export membrane protein
MDYEEQAAKNLTWVSIAQTILRVFGLAFFILLSFLLGEKGVGEYSFVSSFVVLWFIFIDFGMVGFLYREWSKQKDNLEVMQKDFNLVFTIRIILIFFIFLFFSIFNYFFNKDLLLPLTFLFLSVFIGTILDLMDVYFKSVNLFKYLAIRQIIEKIISVVLGVIFLLINRDITSVFFAIFLGHLVALVYYIKIKKLPFNISLYFNKQRSLYLIKRGLPFLFIALFASLYNRIDMTMLKFMDNIESVGFYSVAYRFFDFISLFPAILFIPSIFPVLSVLYEKNGLTEKFNLFFDRAFRIIFSISFVLSLATFFFSPFLVVLFFPDSFFKSVLAIRILTSAHIFATVALLFNSLLAIQEKEKIVLRIVGFSAVLNIFLNFLFIPKYSFYGAAWATLITEVINLFLLQFYLDWKKNLKIIFNMVNIIMLNTLIIVFLHTFGLIDNLLILSVIILLNIIFLFKLRLLNKNDIIFILKPLRSKLNFIIQ